MGHRAIVRRGQWAARPQRQVAPNFKLNGPGHASKLDFEVKCQCAYAAFRLPNTAHKGLHGLGSILRVQPAVVPCPCVCHSGDRSLSSRFWRNVASHHRIEKLHLICMRSISDFPARYHDPRCIASAERWMYGELSFVSMTTLDRHWVPAAYPMSDRSGLDALVGHHWNQG